MTVAEFLLARIAEDEVRVVDMECQCDDGQGQWPDCPDRVLAECEAKRRIVALHTPCHVCTVDETGDDETAWDQRFGTPCPTLAAAATVYADHPDYREEWRSA